MDPHSYGNILDIYSISNEETHRENKTIFNNGNNTKTYDDVFNRKTTKHRPSLNIPNTDDHQCQYAVSHFKRHFLLYVILIISLVTGVVLFVLSYKPKGTQVISSSTKYPLLNPDLCDPVNPYYGRSWFTPSPTDNFICNDPIQISSIYIDSVKVFTGQNPSDCLSKLDCMYLIGLYYLSEYKNPEYNFFIDKNSNVYEGRGWMCPYVSGQLWVGLLIDRYNHNGESEDIKRILKHFNNEIMSYARECGFLRSSSSNISNLNIIYK